MYKVLVFAGTTEGYEICRFLANHRVQTKGFVATEYGSKSLTENEFLTVQTGRLDAAAMEETFLQEKPEMVLDATHPYAAEVTVNIRTACENTQTAYYRVLREAGEHEDRAVYVDSVQAATDPGKCIADNRKQGTGRLHRHEGLSEPSLCKSPFSAQCDESLCRAGI
jgi:precorrin-6Y C5,15-methyltransferase (decarboxylating)